MQIRPGNFRLDASDSRPPLPLLGVSWILVLFCGCSILTAWCQQAQTPSTNQGRTSSTQTGSSPSAKKTPVGVFITLDKKSIVFPNIAADSEPLSTAKKFKLFVDESISLHALAESSLGAAISQAADTPHGYGQGGQGYGKRFGASLAGGASINFFSTFLLASALHQDPRFFPERDPTFGRSIKYSVERLFVTRNDAGRDAANWSGLLGPLLAEGLSNAYWPEQDRTTGQTFQRYGIDFGVRLGENVLRDYWPVFFRKVHGSPAHNQSDQAARNLFTGQRTFFRRATR